MTQEDPSKLPIEVLLQRAQEGDRDAWEELLRRYGPRLKDWEKQCRRDHPSLPGEFGPSDITQETALKAFSHLPSFRGSTDGELWSWFKTTLNTTLLDKIRRATRQKRGEGETLSMDTSEVQNIPAIQHTPSQLSAQKERGRQLLGAFLQLTKEQREALSPYLLRGSSRESLMARSGHSREAMDSLLRRGMRTLEALMEGRAEVEPQDPREILRRNHADAALSLYFRRLEEGVPVDPQAFVSDYPDCAEELLGLLRWLEALRSLDSDT